MRKNILVYNNCSDIAEKILPFCAGEGISVHKIVTGKEWNCSLIYQMLI